MENDENIHYVGDGGVLGSGAANISLIMKITGDFLDDGDQLNSRYLRSLPSSDFFRLSEAEIVF